MKITNEITPNQTAAEADFAGLEAAIGVALPQAYAQFLKEFNGGIPARSYFRCEALDTAYKVERLLSVAEVHTVWRNLEHEFAPNELLPVAQTIGTSVVCISLGNDDRGHVFIYDWDFGVEEIANAFERFLNDLELEFYTD